MDISGGLSILDYFPVDTVSASPDFGYALVGVESHAGRYYQGVHGRCLATTVRRKDVPAVTVTVASPHGNLVNSSWKAETTEHGCTHCYIIKTSAIGHT